MFEYIYRVLRNLSVVNGEIFASESFQNVGDSIVTIVLKL